MNDNNNLEYLVQNAIDYKSVVNRVLVRQTAPDKYDLSLKPKFLILDTFPSFSHVELHTKENKVIKAVYHYQIVVYFVFALMSAVMFFMMISVDYFYAVFLIVWSALVAIFKFYGYKELKRISNNFLEPSGKVVN